MVADKPFIWLVREGKYHLELGEASIGYLPRIDNFIDGFEKHFEKLQGALDELLARRRHIEISLHEVDEYSPKITALQNRLKKLDEELGVNQ